MTKGNRLFMRVSTGWGEWSSGKYIGEVTYNDGIFKTEKTIPNVSTDIWTIDFKYLRYSKNEMKIGSLRDAALLLKIKGIEGSHTDLSSSYESNCKKLK